MACTWSRQCESRKHRRGSCHQRKGLHAEIWAGGLREGWISGAAALFARAACVRVFWWEWAGGPPGWQWVTVSGPAPWALPPQSYRKGLGPMISGPSSVTFSGCPVASLHHQKPSLSPTVPVELKRLNMAVKALCEPTPGDFEIQPSALPAFSFQVTATWSQLSPPDSQAPCLC